MSTEKTKLKNIDEEKKQKISAILENHQLILNQVFCFICGGAEPIIDKTSFHWWSQVNKLSDKQKELEKLSLEELSNELLEIEKRALRSCMCY